MITQLFQNRLYPIELVIVQACLETRMQKDYKMGKKDIIFNINMNTMMTTPYRNMKPQSLPHT